MMAARVMGARSIGVQYSIECDSCATVNSDKHGFHFRDRCVEP
jgi:hypothetical protein